MTKKQIGKSKEVNKTKKIEIPSTPNEKDKPLKKKKVSLNWKPAYKGSNKTKIIIVKKKIIKLKNKETCFIRIIFFLGINKINKKEEIDKKKSVNNIFLI